MRPLLFWLITTVIAVLAARGADEAPHAGDLLWAPDAEVHLLHVPEPSRAFLLGVGIMAIAFTYRQAWLNLKRKG